MALMRFSSEPMGFLAAYLHFVGFLALISLLAGEFFLLRKPLEAHSLPLLKKIDLLYGSVAGLVLVTGIARIFYEKGWQYYSHNAFFWAKMALFVTIAVVSIYPTAWFLKARSPSEIGIDGYAKIRRAVLAQLLLAPLIVFCAIWMARGIY
jgi:putative membrane protein